MFEKPSLDDLRQAAHRLGMHPSDDYLRAVHEIVTPLAGAYAALDDAPDELPVVKYPRGPFHFPQGEENRYGAWYVKTSIKGAPGGKLAGRRVALKDNICLADVPMMIGADLLERYVPEVDATVVERVLDAGGEIAGKAVCEYYCVSGGSHTSRTGPVHNPRKPGYTTGGSSSGSAALVASGDVDMAIGGDQAGSIRIPASHCGIVGLKPTYGLVPYTGIAPLEITLFLQQICDHGEYFELQPDRARNLVTAFGRIGGHVVGVVANNSAVASGQIDVDAARKGTRFIRFCNLYNVPMIFLEDVTGFLPGTDQESRGIILEGRRLLDSIIDLRVPRLTLIIRNAFGGAYAAYNSHFVGADMVFAMPHARIAVMGPAGKDFVYKDELREIETAYRQALAKGAGEAEARKRRDEALARLNERYEHELMNPKEALSLGSVSRIVMPGESRRVLAESLDFLMRTYTPTPMAGPQREFE